MTEDEKLAACEAYLKKMGRIQESSKLVFAPCSTIRFIDIVTSETRDSWTIDEVNAKSGKLVSWGLISHMLTKAAALGELRRCMCDDKSYAEMQLMAAIEGR